MNINFGENLKELRLKKNLTQEKIAEILGVSFQTVSKWERGDTYPDITMIPDIADFFKVSVDSLLGVNKAKNEQKILEIIDKVDNLTDCELRGKIIEDAIKEFPTDFRLQLRQMGQLYFSSKEEDIKDKFPKIKSIYENIQQNCTIDTIRICAKWYMASCYSWMSEIDGSGIGFEDCEKIIKEMPYMRDGQEFLSSYLYKPSHPNYYDNIKEAIEQEVGLLSHGLDRFYCDDNFSTDYKIEVHKMNIAIHNYIFNDGNYGCEWRAMMYLYLELGYLYYQKGDNTNAITNIKKSAELAKQFDEMDRITIMHSLILDGKKFDKHTVGSTFIACSRMKELINERYPFSKEFKQSADFQQIIRILD